MSLIATKTLMQTIHNVFKKMLKADVQFKRVRMGLPDDIDLPIRGVITYHGDCEGVICLQMPEKMACQLVSNFIRQPVEPKDPFFLDGAGEILNMVAGAIKAELGMGNISMDCPKVLALGDSIDRPNEAADVVVYARCFEEDFRVEISLIDKPAAAGQMRAAG